MPYSPLISSKGGAPSASAAAVSAAVDTTTATLLTAQGVYVYNGAGVTVALTDSNVNAGWVLLTERSTTLGGGFFIRIRFYYCVNPTVGAGHTVTLTPTGAPGYCGVSLQAWTGNHRSLPFNLEAAGGTTAPGSMTPTYFDSMVLQAVAHGDASGVHTLTGYTILQDLAGVTGSSTGVTVGYQLQTTPTATAPTWAGTFTAVPIPVSTGAVFKPPVGGQMRRWRQIPGLFGAVRRG